MKSLGQWMLECETEDPGYPVPWGGMVTVTNNLPEGKAGTSWDYGCNTW